MYFWLGPLLIVFNFDAKSSCYLCICVAHLVARVAIAAVRVAAACLEQFRSTASVRLDDFMENFIEQAETFIWRYKCCQVYFRATTGHRSVQGGY